MIPSELVFVQIIVIISVLYSLLGLVFAVWFVTHGVTQLDDVARHATLGFRLLILPGAAALWPMILIKFMRQQRET